MTGTRIIAIVTAMAVRAVIQYGLAASGFVIFPLGLLTYLLARYVGWAIRERRRFKQDGFDRRHERVAALAAPTEPAGGATPRCPEIPRAYRARREAFGAGAVQSRLGSAGAWAIARRRGRAGSRRQGVAMTWLVRATTTPNGANHGPVLMFGKPVGIIVG
jgi:hypothetical protein